jgi:hypothetical protein
MPIICGTTLNPFLDTLRIANSGVFPPGIKQDNDQRLTGNLGLHHQAAP